MNRLAIYIFGNLIYFISALFPKSNRIWIYGSWVGKQYADNPKYLFEFVSNHHPEIKSIWLASDNHILLKLKNNGYEAYRCWSLLGLYYSCRAKVGVTSHGMVDINRFACARMKIVQTWHGIPMKPVLLSDPKPDARNKRKQLEKLSVIFPFLRKEIFFDKNLVVCSTSEYVSKLLKLVFGSQAPIQSLGFPKLDRMFKPNETSDLGKELMTYKAAGKSIAIYLPTYRSPEEFDIIGYLVENKDCIIEHLTEEDQILYLKIHPFHMSKVEEIKWPEKIRLISNEDIDGDIYSVLGHFDELITDFSSIVFDFLITERPAYLVVPDRKNYISSNGEFVYDYQKIGLPIFASWLELIKGKKSTEQNVNLKKISTRYHFYKDDLSSKRLYEHIQQHL